MADLEAKVKELEAQLRKEIAYREELERDVENLCMQGSGSSTFSGSSVLSERIYSTEKELVKVKAQLAAVVAERDNLREDLRGFKDSKRTVDASWRVERERSDNLEKELAFYQSQSTRAISDRDRATWEAEDMRSQMLAMSARLRDAESQADADRSQRQETERSLQAAQQQIGVLEEQVRECALLPGLRQDLAEAQASIASLERERNDLQAQLAQAQSGLDDVQQQLAQLQGESEALAGQLAAACKAAEDAEEEHEEEIEQLQAEMEKLKATTAAAEERADEAEGSLAAAQAEIEVVRRETQKQLAEHERAGAASRAERDTAHAKELAGLRQQVQELQARFDSTKAQMEQASQEKVEALIRLSTAQSAASQAADETRDLQTQVADLQKRLQQATQEKVNALMQLAERRESNGIKASPKASGGWGWRSSTSPGAAPASAKSASLAISVASPPTSPPSSTRSSVDLRPHVTSLEDKLRKLASLAASTCPLREVLGEALELITTYSKPSAQWQHASAKVEQVAAQIEALQSKYSHRDAAAPVGKQDAVSKTAADGKGHADDLRAEAAVQQEMLELLHVAVAALRSAIGELV